MECFAEWGVERLDPEAQIRQSLVRCDQRRFPDRLLRSLCEGSIRGNVDSLTLCRFFRPQAKVPCKASIVAILFESSGEDSVQVVFAVRAS